MNLKLTTSEFDDHFGMISDQKLPDPSAYQRLLGRLLYLTNTRSDIAFAIQSFSQFMHSPKVSHMAAAMRLVRYVKHSPSLGILISAAGDDHLHAFYGTNWGSCPNT